MLYAELPSIVNEILAKNDFSTAIKNGFRKSGLFPWNPDALDYTKTFISKETNPWASESLDTVQDDTPLNTDSSVTGKMFMEIFEENLDPLVLQEFRETLSSSCVWEGSSTNAGLYKMWLTCYGHSETFIPNSGTIPPHPSKLSVDGTVLIPMPDELMTNDKQSVAHYKVVGKCKKFVIACTYT